LERLKKTAVKLSSGYLVSRPRFEQDISQIQTYSAVAAPSCSIPEYRKQRIHLCHIILYVLEEECETLGLPAVCCPLININIIAECGPTPCPLFLLI